MFTIDEETGEISIIDKVDSMDTPRGQYELVVRATDYGKIDKNNIIYILYNIIYIAALSSNKLIM